MPTATPVATGNQAGTGQLRRDVGFWVSRLTATGFVGRYGHGARMYLPEWIDLAVVVAFSLAIFYFAVAVALDGEQVRAAVEEEAGMAPRSALPDRELHQQRARLRQVQGEFGSA